MFIIGTDNLSVSFGENVILENVSFSINQGEKVSIVGVNGAGKSTLMRALMGSGVPYTGNVFIAKGKTLGHLEQKNDFDSEKTVIEAALDVFCALMKEEAELEELSNKMETDYSDETIARYTAKRQRFEAAGGYEYRSRARGTLIGMGFSQEDLNRRVKTLSGGQQTILKLSLLILQEPDILLLDEPTNHLDIKALEWLEERLKRIKSTLIVISHDRLFLDRVTDKTLEIENTHAKLYPVGYTQYREQKKIDREIQDRHYKNQQKEIARIEAFIAQQKRWNRERNIIAAESRQKALDRMVKVEKAEALPQSLSFQFQETLESGYDVLSVKELSKGYGNEFLFKDLSFEIKKDDRFLIIGANGSGKSTLLQIIAGALPPDSGSFRFGYNVRVGYYDQYQHLNESSTVLEEIWQDSELNHTEIRTLLATFLFRGDDVFKEIRVLSGGERARLVLAKLMQKKVNLLLLDEPTNHLDIESREALENALESFHGTIIAVSHDRYFIKKLATRILNFNGNGNLTLFNGNYVDYKERGEGKASDVAEIKEASSATKMDYESAKRKKQEERKKNARLEKIQKEIEDAEQRIAEIDREMSSIRSDYVRLQALYDEKEQLSNRCDKLFEEWSALEE